VLEVSKTEMPVTYKCVDTTGRSNDNVWVGIFVAEELDILLHGRASVEHTDPDIGQELGEAVVLIADLVGQLTSVAHDEDGCSTGLWLLVHLLESGEHEDGGLSETGLCLAEDIVS